MTPLEPDDAAMLRLGEAVFAFAREHVGTLATQPSHDVENAAPLTASFREPLPRSGVALESLLARLAPAFAKSFNTAGPGYLAYIPGGGIYSAALADFMAAACNRYVGVDAAAPVLAQVERTAVAWLCAMMGYPASAGGILTSGGSLSNLSAVLAARDKQLGREFARGVLYHSAEAHHSVAKAARIVGIDADNLRAVPVDSRLRMRVDALAAMVAADRGRGLSPFLVVGSAGTTNTGAVDPFPELAAVCRAQSLWLHADAAYGGFFRLADPALLPGVELADSITIDPHKGLFLPYGTGALLVRDVAALRAAHRGSADYLQDLTPAGADEEVGHGFADMSPELSRDFRGLRIWLPLQLHGADAFRDALVEKRALALFAYRELANDGRFEFTDAPQLSIVAFRLAGRSDADNAELLRRINARKRVFISSTRVNGRYYLRFCVLSVRTHEDRVREAIDAARAEAGSV